MGNRETTTTTNWQLSAIRTPPIPTRDPYRYKSSQDYYNEIADAVTLDCKQIQTKIYHQGHSILTPHGGGYSSLFLPSPTGEGYINTPEEMIVNWWISKLPFKEWYANNFLQQKIDFNN